MFVLHKLRLKKKCPMNLNLFCTSSWWAHFELANFTGCFTTRPIFRVNWKWSTIQRYWSTVSFFIMLLAKIVWRPFAKDSNQTYIFTTNCCLEMWFGNILFKKHERIKSYLILLNTNLPRLGKTWLSYLRCHLLLLILLLLLCTKFDYPQNQETNKNVRGTLINFEGELIRLVLLNFFPKYIIIFSWFFNSVSFKDDFWIKRQKCFLSLPFLSWI